MGYRKKNSKDFTVLLTKTFKPPIHRSYLMRYSLIDKLEKGLISHLTILSAATGFGKSVTVSQWLSKNKHKYSWLSLDEEHNDVNVFLTYILFLFKQQYPKKTFGLESLIDTFNISSNLIVKTIINDLCQFEDFFILVLDDYHIINEQQVHEIINGILLHPPIKFHLVILSQRDPPIKMIKLRSKFQVNELRMKDLIFTTEEALKLRSLISNDVLDEDVKRISKLTDGWITGIIIGFMGLSRGITLEKILDALQRRDSIISELLNEAVIKGLPIHTKKYLEISSLVDRFSIDLLEFMIASINEARISIREEINLSKKNNLFLIPLDYNHEWFRYHHLFQQQIKTSSEKNLNNEEISSLYKAASIWFEKEGILEEAFKYGIYSKDIAFVVQMFSRHRLELHNTEQFQRLERLINLFPENTINNNLELLLSLAILQDHKANFQGMLKYLERAGKILDNYTIKDTQFNQLKGQFHSVCAYLPFMQGDYHASICEAETAMKLLPASEPNYFREYALAYYALGHQAVGKTEVGLNEISNRLEGPTNNDKYFIGRLLHIKTLVYSIAGDADKMRISGVQLQTLNSPQNFPGAWMAGIYATVTSAYISNKLQEVHQFHKELFKNRFTGRPFGVTHHFLVECLASFALGCWEDLDSCIAHSKELAADLQIPPLQGMVYAFEVEIALMQNNIDYAIEISALANFNPHPPLWYYYIPQLTEVKLLFYTNEQKKALELLEELIKSGKGCHNKNLLIQALVLKAVFLEERGERKLALEVLTEALVLSKNKGYVRTFVNYGTIMNILIDEVTIDKVGTDQVNKIKQAIIKTSHQHVTNDLEKGRLIKKNHLLSKRELEILRLVVEGYKNAEIADRLFISLDTVKKHLYKTYQKLNVKNRAGAIKKASDLRLVSSE